MPSPQDCIDQFNKDGDLQRYRECMTRAGALPRPDEPVTTGLPGITEQYNSLGMELPDVNKLAQDVGYSALIVLGLMMAPKVIELGINTAAALYKQGAPGDSILG